MLTYIKYAIIFVCISIGAGLMIALAPFAFIIYMFVVCALYQICKVCSLGIKYGEGIKLGIIKYTYVAVTLIALFMTLGSPIAGRQYSKFNNDVSDYLRSRIGSNVIVLDTISGRSKAIACYLFLVIDDSREIGKGTFEFYQIGEDLGNDGLINGAREYQFNLKSNLDDILELLDSGNAEDELLQSIQINSVITVEDLRYLLFSWICYFICLFLFIAFKYIAIIFVRCVLYRGKVSIRTGALM